MADFWDDQLVELGIADPPPIVLPMNGNGHNGNGHRNGHGRPPTDPEAAHRYAAGALRSACDNIARSATRNHTLYIEACGMRELINAGAIGEAEVIAALRASCAAADTRKEDPFLPSEYDATLRSAFNGMDAKGATRDLSMVRPLAAVTSGTDVRPPPRAAGDEAEPEPQPLQRISLLPLSRITSAAPTWAWEHSGHGRIQRGTLCLLAGRPGAGKSNAARWFAAGYTNGTMDGCFYGHPVNVAYISPAEESHVYVIKPGLIAAGADPARISFPEVRDDEGNTIRLLSANHEVDLTKVLRANEVRVVIVDPVMSTIPGQVDVNRNNETRAYVEPWARIATNIDGIILGVAHLVKHPGSDLVAAINGSSAFGEVARSIFGFVKDRASGERVMSQVKNSAGHEDLSLTYEITSTEVPVDTGEITEVATFAITGTSMLNAAELLDADRDGESVVGRADIAQLWLQDYLESEGRARPVKVIVAGKDEGHARSTLYRAAKKIGVVVDYEGMPRVAWWKLPVSFYEGLRGTTGVTEGSVE